MQRAVVGRVSDLATDGLQYAPHRQVLGIARRAFVLQRRVGAQRLPWNSDGLRSQLRRSCVTASARDDGTPSAFTTAAPPRFQGSGFAATRRYTTEGPWPSRHGLSESQNLMTRSIGWGGVCSPTPPASRRRATTIAMAPACDGSIRAIPCRRSFRRHRRGV